MAEEPDGSTGKNTTLFTTTTTTTTVDPAKELQERREMIEAFYNTYDVMTGVRIAATLGGFFGLMVILVLYKSKSKTEKAMEDPDFTAAAVAEVEEEEERQLAAVLEAEAYQQLSARGGRGRRLTVDASMMPLGFRRPSTRFSSVGGYSSLMEPPTRIHSRLPSFIDEDSPPEDDCPSLYDDVYNYNGHLDVPRRPSNITCSSSGSSYLERRDSAVAIGLPALPAHKSSSRKSGHSPLQQIYDFYYPIDIKVIQPTPGGSPCNSDRALYDHVAQVNPHLGPRLAPLASISSCNSSLGPDVTEDVEMASYDASDSVFRDPGDPDTDDDVDQFSTDSDMSEAGACFHRRRKKMEPPSAVSSRSSLTLVENPEALLAESTYLRELEDEKRTQETLF